MTEDEAIAEYTALWNGFLAGNQEFLLGVAVPTELVQNRMDELQDYISQERWKSFIHELPGLKESLAAMAQTAEAISRALGVPDG